MLDLKKLKNNDGFSLIELLVAIFIASLIVGLLLPNLVNEYKYMKKAEDEIKMRTILYEEILANKKDINFVRDGYDISIMNNRARIRDINSGKEIIYSK
ncbi:MULTISPECIES: type II secretion system protein [unclassified Gemella]|uniref:type II secretion system protein n=1 Tax=unclassified Gemella TaxID=2624949 RepID=UPI0010731C04|nr:MULTISPECIES: type II secretion system protein [unclassified Gemella]MBF0709769.1 type II secretion system protein [Gemella sp. GL1.1]MBF0747143.1 type II secretion system protein [Gemella sp. 19428wG2_WT2a]NYS27113.1 type II secretion system protein [Gemella sp. GL1]TFU58383.1 type II secretion system protein [Gemella sp. WT2a]